VAQFLRSPSWFHEVVHNDAQGQLLLAQQNHYVTSYLMAGFFLQTGSSRDK
jgi:hypothetical protein